MTNRKIVAGVLTGLAAGAVISLILSSKKGRQAGKDLLKSSNRLTDELKEKFNDFVDGMQTRVKGILK